MASLTTSKPRFSTIIVSRGKDNRPSDLEFGLRSHCQRLIVKGKPLSGAHLLVTSERIALRAYYPCDLRELQEKEKQEQEEGGGTQRMKTRYDKTEESPDPNEKDDFDGLSGFFSSFELALVLFIMLPTNTAKIKISIAQQLDDVNSHFHRAQRLSIRHQQETAAKNSTDKNKSHVQCRVSTGKSCVVLLPDTESAIENLIALADSAAPGRKESKRALFQRLEAKYFLPSSPRNDGDGNVLPGPTSTKSDAAAIKVAEGLREIARTFELPLGEANILMSELGDLKTIASADDSLLATIPIDRRTRKVLHGFFGSSVGGKGDLQLQEPTLLRHPDLHSLKSVATQLFPQSTSSPSSFSIPNSANGRSVPPSAHPYQAHQQALQAQQPYQHQLDSNLVDEFWVEKIDALGTNTASFYTEDDEIPDIYDAFDLNKNKTTIIPSHLPEAGSIETDRLKCGDHPLGVYHRCSRFSAIHLPASSSLGIENTIEYRGDLQFYQQYPPQINNNPCLQQKHHDTQPTFPKFYDRLPPRNYQNGMNHRQSHIHQHKPPGLLFSSFQQREHRQPRRR